MFGFIEKIGSIIAGDGYDEEEYEEEEFDSPSDGTLVIPINRNRDKGRNSYAQTTSNRIVMYCPEKYEDAQIICDNMKQEKAVIVNLEKVDFELSQRIVDFLSGVCYSLDGSIQKVTNKILVLAPKNTDISGDFEEEIIKAKSSTFSLASFR